MKRNLLPGFKWQLFLIMCSYETERERGRERQTDCRVLINVCLTHTDADRIPVNRHQMTKKKLKDRMWRLRPSFMLQRHKSNAENCWTAARCQSRKKRERGGVSLLKASGLYWPVFQRSDAWISHRNYLSRTILFIAVWVLIALLHPEQAESLGWCFFLPQWDKNTSCFHSSK